MTKTTSQQKQATKADDGDPNANKGGKSAWFLAGFFVVLLAMNATFFAVAFSNPPVMHPTVDEFDKSRPTVTPDSPETGTASPAAEKAGGGY